MKILSNLLYQLRQSINFKGKATFWFNGIIASVLQFIDKQEYISLNENDQDQYSYVQLMNILNKTIVSGMVFYSDNPPENYYKFTAFCHQLVNRNYSSSLKKFNSGTFQNQKETEKKILSRFVLRNNLLIQALQRKQYGIVFWGYQQMMREFNEANIDSCNVIYLTFFSNFLTLISKLKNSKNNSPVAILVEMISKNLITLFIKLVQKHLQSLQQQQQIQVSSKDLQILIAIFLKHISILSAKVSSQFQFLINKVTVQAKHYSLSNNVYLQKVYKDKLKRQIVLDLEVPFHEFNCFSASIIFPKKNNSKVKKYLSTKQQSQKQEAIANQRLMRIQKMLQQLSSQRRDWKLSTQKISKQFSTERTVEQFSATEMIPRQQSSIIYINEENPQKKVNITQNQIQTNTIDDKIYSLNLKSGRFRKLNNRDPNIFVTMNQSKRTGQNQLNPVESSFSSYQTLSNNLDLRKTQQKKDIDLYTERKSSKCKHNYGVMQHMVSPTKIKYNNAKYDPKKCNNNLNISSVLNHSQINSQAIHHPLLRIHKVLHFKMGSIFIQVNDDGMIFSDYTKQNKRYVEWNTISQIILRLQFKFIYKYFLSQTIFNYYDIVRILKFYLSKSQNNSITINQFPNMILQLNQFIRFYQQDGHYTKLVHMNIYDNSKLESQIDCYFQQFQHFFKTLSSDGYLQCLEQRVLQCDKIERSLRQQVYYLEVLRKQNDSIRLELQNQLTVDILQSVINDRNFIYRVLFVLKNNVRLYAKIQLTLKEKKDHETNNPSKQSNQFTVIIKNLSEHALPVIRHTLSLNSLHHYFPQQEQSAQNYIQSYGRYIFQSFNNLQTFSDGSAVSMLNFQIITHCSQTEMIEIGKYWTVCSAQIIGSKKTIYGIVIRYAFLPMNKDYVTFLRNPYGGFLRGLISMTKDEKKDSLKRLLIDESVKQTYLYLQRNKKLNMVSSLMEYLQEGLGII